MRTRYCGGPPCGKSLQKRVQAMGRKPLGETAHSPGTMNRYRVSTDHVLGTMHVFISAWLGDKRAKGPHNEIVFTESLSSSVKWECSLDNL